MLGGFSKGTSCAPLLSRTWGHVLFLVPAGSGTFSSPASNPLHILLIASTNRAKECSLAIHPYHARCVDEFTGSSEHP